MTSAPTDSKTTTLRARRLALVGSALATAATLAAGIRWWLQRAHLDGQGNVYTALERHFYEPDALLGFRQTEAHWVWLGLDLVGVLAGVAVATGVLAWLVPWLSRRAPRLTLAAAITTIGVSVVAFLPSVVAFASGMPPEGVSASVPGVALDAGGQAGSFASGQAGTYVVTDDEVSTIVGQVTAGGETFDIKFAPIEGEVTFDPTALTETPVAGRIVIDVATLDSGVPLRSDHAREYLAAETHPEIVLSVSGLDSTAISDDGDTVTWSANATLELMGRSHPTEVRGQLVAIDTDEERTRLGLDGASPAYLLRSEFTVNITDTNLAAEIEAFDAPTIPITTRLLLVRQDLPSP